MQTEKSRQGMDLSKSEHNNAQHDSVPLPTMPLWTTKTWMLNFFESQYGSIPHHSCMICFDLGWYRPATERKYAANYSGPPHSIPYDVGMASCGMMFIGQCKMSDLQRPEQTRNRDLYLVVLLKMCFGPLFKRAYGWQCRVTSGCKPSARELCSGSCKGQPAAPSCRTSLRSSSRWGAKCTEENRWLFTSGRSNNVHVK